MEDNNRRSEGADESMPRMQFKTHTITPDDNKKVEKNYNKTELLFKKMKSNMLKELRKREETKEWERYLNCNNLPYPNIPSNVNQHFMTWCHDTKFATLQELDASLTTYLPTFDVIKLITDYPIKMKAHVINSLREIMQNWKCEFIDKIDYACFVMIKDIRKHFTFMDYYRRNYEGSFENFEIGMWALLDVPFSSIYKLNRHIIYFPNIDATVTLPLSYNCKPIVLRVMYTPFDFLSDLSNSKNLPEFKLNDLSIEIKKCGNLMETLDLTTLQREKDSVIKFGKQSTVSERQLSFQKNYASITNPSLTYSQDSRSIYSSHSIYQQKPKLMSKYSKDVSNGTSIIYDQPDRFRKLQSPWDPKRIGKCRSTTDSIASSITTLTAGKSSLMHRIFSFESSVLDDLSNEDINEDKGGKPCEWNFSDWEVFISGDQSIDESTSFLDLIFNFEESSTYMSLVGILIKDELLFKKDITGSKDFTSIINKCVKNEENYKLFVQQLAINTKPREVNLRCYHSFSGVYYIDLIKHLSDIYQLKIGDFVQFHKDGLCQLENENFLVDISEISSKETSESFTMNCEYYFNLNNINKKKNYAVSSVKRNSCETVTIPIENQTTTVSHDVTNLIKVKVSLSKKVYWFMKPQPAVWDKENKFWSVEHVCDVEHDYEHNTIEFKLGKLGPIAMFTFRFHELPYKNWSLSIDNNEEIVLILEGQHLTTQFNIVDDKICLKNVHGISKHLLDDIIGKLVELPELVTKMKSIGLDMFPETDSFLYVKQCSAKPLALEDHSYYTMAIFSNITEFKASSWNMAFGHKEILFQFRLNTCHKTNPYQTLLCSYFGCEVLMIEDEADVLTDMTNKVIGHYSGPFSTLSKMFKNKINLLPEDLPKIDAVYNILRRTKILTYSGNPAKSL